MPQLFPRWTNTLPLKIAICLVLLGTGVTAAVWITFTPKYTRVGYQPGQPVPFSHRIHVGELGMDCRHCHSFAESSSHSNVPTAEACMNCHRQVKAQSPKLAPVREAYATGKPVEWVRVHKAPDYVYFNHSVHLNRGISCQDCHGQIDKMDVVHQAEPQSMGWCLDCHRNPSKSLRPLGEVVNFRYDPASLDREAFYGELMADGHEPPALIAALERENGLAPSGAEDLESLLTLAEKTFGEKMKQEEVGQQLQSAWGVRPPEHCTACHR